MKRIALMLMLALFGLQGFSMEKAKVNDKVMQETTLVTLDNENNASLIPCRVWLVAEGGTWYIQTEYPVASDINVIIDGPNLPGAPYTVYEGTDKANTGIASHIVATIAEILGGQDDTFVYVISN